MNSLSQAEWQKKWRQRIYFYLAGSFALGVLSRKIDSPEGFVFPAVLKFAVLILAAYVVFVWRNWSFLRPQEKAGSEKVGKNGLIHIPSGFFLLVALSYPYAIVFNALLPIGPDATYTGLVVRRYERARHRTAPPRRYIVIADPEHGEASFEVTLTEYERLKEGSEFSVALRRGALGIPYRWNLFGNP